MLFYLQLCLGSLLMSGIVRNSQDTASTQSGGEVASVGPD